MIDVVMLVFIVCYLYICIYQGLRVFSPSVSSLLVDRVCDNICEYMSPHVRQMQHDRLRGAKD
jgi:hypothetical protein